MGLNYDYLYVNIFDINEKILLSAIVKSYIKDKSVFCKLSAEKVNKEYL